MSGKGQPPGSRLDEIADAAARAFRMLPAMPQDILPRGGAEARRPPIGSLPPRTRWNGT